MTYQFPSIGHVQSHLDACYSDVFSKKERSFLAKAMGGQVLSDAQVEGLLTRVKPIEEDSCFVAVHCCLDRILSIAREL